MLVPNRPSVFLLPCVCFISVPSGSARAPRAGPFAGIVPQLEAWLVRRIREPRARVRIRGSERDAEAGGSEGPLSRAEAERGEGLQAANDSPRASKLRPNSSG